MGFRGPLGPVGQRRNYSDRTARGYLQAVEAFAKHFGRPPDQLGPDDLRRYQAYLLKERKLAVGTVIARVAALRFLFVRTLKRYEFRQDLPYPKKQRRLPRVLSLEEVARLINAAGNLQQRTLLMILYGTGMRRAEVSRLKVRDVDSQRMIIRVERGKGGNDRDLPLSPASVRNTPRVLALEEATNLSVSQWEWPPWSRAAHFRQERLVRLHRSSATRRHYQARYAAHPSTYLGDPLTGSGHRPANDSDPARPRRSGDHCQVSSPVPAASACGCQSAGPTADLKR